MAMEASAAAVSQTLTPSDPRNAYVAPEPPRTKALAKPIGGIREKHTFASKPSAMNRRAISLVVADSEDEEENDDIVLGGIADNGEAYAAKESDVALLPSPSKPSTNAGIADIPRKSKKMKDVRRTHTAAARLGFTARQTPNVSDSDDEISALGPKKAKYAVKGMDVDATITPPSPVSEQQQPIEDAQHHPPTATGMTTEVNAAENTTEIRWSSSSGLSADTKAESARSSAKLKLVLVNRSRTTIEDKYPIFDELPVVSSTKKRSRTDVALLDDEDQAPFWPANSRSERTKRNESRKKRETSDRQEERTVDGDDPLFRAHALGLRVRAPKTVHKNAVTEVPESSAVIATQTSIDSVHVPASKPILGVRQILSGSHGVENMTTISSAQVNPVVEVPPLTDSQKELLPSNTSEIPSTVASSTGESNSGGAAASKVNISVGDTTTEDDVTKPTMLKKSRRNGKKIDASATGEDDSWVDSVLAEIQADVVPSCPKRKRSAASKTTVSATREANSARTAIKPDLSPFEPACVAEVEPNRNILASNSAHGDERIVKTPAKAKAEMSQQTTPPRVTAQAPATASVPSKASGSTPGSAPRYRVGLSKRSKVPSLLKSVKRS